mmetsp:Transcript_142533/g.454853  ORF Transcript_142533/g.454853 Transcript_142533/m.454853 type:complete len:85 (-) Transcript_142533:1090-1344(-)
MEDEEEQEKHSVAVDPQLQGSGDLAEATPEAMEESGAQVAEGKARATACTDKPEVKSEEGCADIAFARVASRFPKQALQHRPGA